MPIPPGMRLPVFPDIPGQRGLATSWQLRQHGWSYSAMSSLVSGPGQRVLPRVYLPHRQPVDDDDLIVAGWLWAGRDTILTGAGALARHGIDIGKPGPITRYLTKRDARNREANHGMELRRSRRLPRGIVRNDVPTVPVERALVDAARFKEASPGTLTGWTMTALQKKLTLPDRVDAEVTASGWLGLGAITRGCTAFRRGAWSVPEATLIQLVEEDERFPRMLANPRLEDAVTHQFVGIPDGYFPEEGVAVQVHSRQFHEGEDEDGHDRWASTVETDNTYAPYGIPVVGVVPKTLVTVPDRFLDNLAATLAAHRGREPRRVRVVEPGAVRQI